MLSSSFRNSGQETFSPEYLSELGAKFGELNIHHFMRAFKNDLSSSLPPSSSCIIGVFAKALQLEPDKLQRHGVNHVLSHLGELCVGTVCDMKLEMDRLLWPPAKMCIDWPALLPEMQHEVLWALQRGADRDYACTLALAMLRRTCHREHDRVIPPLPGPRVMRKELEWPEYLRNTFGPTFDHDGTIKPAMFALQTGHWIMFNELLSCRSDRDMESPLLGYAAGILGDEVVIQKVGFMFEDAFRVSNHSSPFPRFFRSGYWVRVMKGIICKGSQRILFRYLLCREKNLLSLHGFEIAEDCARYGRLKFLQDARRNGCPWDARICELAARYGHLKVLKYAHENGCPWDVRACAGAAEYGHLAFLEYALDHGCPQPRIWNYNDDRIGDCLRRRGLLPNDQRV